MASRPCVACGSSEQRKYGRLKTGQYLRCARCGLICQDGSIPYADTQQRYELPSPEWEVERFEDLPHRHRQAPAAVLRSIRQYKAQSGSLLDVGCFRGFTLRYFEMNGWTDLTGIEPSGAAAEFARNQLGLNVSQGYLEDYAADPAHRQFDVVLTLQVLEHTPDPAAFLQCVRRVMKPDGTFLVEVPYFSGPNVWFKSARSRLGFGNPPWRHLGFPKHVFNFTAKSLTSLLQRSGFELLELNVRSKAREHDGPVGRLFHRLKSRLGWGSTLHVVARIKP